MGLLDSIKNDVKKAGTNKGKFLFFKDGTKLRIRFLSDMEDGLEVPFHDSFAKSINLPCQEVFGRECKYCEMEDVRTRNQYVWSVWDYEAKEVKLLMFAVNNCTPIPSLAAFYETYGTLCDRDYVITRTGKGQSTSYSVVPMDKVKFRNDKAKPFSKAKTLQMIDKAYSDDDAEDEDEDLEEEKPEKKRKSKPSSSKKPKNDDADDWDEDESEEDENDYEDMTAKELYNLCKERGIDARPRKSEAFYIKLLKEYDKTKDDWDEDSDDADDWDEEEEED